MYRYDTPTVDTQRADAELAEAQRHFDAALEFASDYAAAQPWQVGDHAARNAAIALYNARIRGEL